MSHLAKNVVEAEDGLFQSEVPAVLELLWSMNTTGAYLAGHPTG